MNPIEYLYNIPYFLLTPSKSVVLSTTVLTEDYRTVSGDHLGFALPSLQKPVVPLPLQETRVLDTLPKY